MKAFQSSRRQSIVYYALPAVLLAAALLAIAHSAVRIAEPPGGIDGHAYWYNGHFIRQGRDPYAALRNKEQPSVPVTYLDGKRTEELPISQQGLSRTPANTPAMVLLLAPLAFFSWPTARMAMFAVNLALMLVIPMLTVRLLPQTLPRYFVLILCLLFYGLQGTRVAVWTLQSTLLVFALMLGALLTLNRTWPLPGLLLGLALSKFSIAIPVFLFVAYRRRYRVLVASLLVQLVGLGLMSLIIQRSPVNALVDYWSVLWRHVDLPGIHLMSLIEGRPILTLSVLVGGSVIVFALLFLWLPKGQERPRAESRLTFAEYHALTALLLWSLLVAYHRVYDTVLVIVFVALLVFGLVRERGWRLSKTGHRLALIYLMVFVAIMMIPGTVMGILLSDQQLETWLHLGEASITLGLLSALIVTLVLLEQLHKGQSIPLDLPGNLREESGLAP